MADVTTASFEQMEPIHEGFARRARATLGVTSFGMQVMTLPVPGTFAASSWTELGGPWPVPA